MIICKVSSKKEAYEITSIVKLFIVSQSTRLLGKKKKEYILLINLICFHTSLKQIKN